jgi:uncharacterized protein YuzE
MFIEYNENDEPVGIELWRARVNVFGELLKYLNKLTEVKGSKKSSYTKKMKPLVQ